MYALMKKHILTTLLLCYFFATPSSAQNPGSWASTKVADYVQAYHLVFADSLHGYVGGKVLGHHYDADFQAYKLFRTIDGGLSWKQLKLPAGSYPFPRSIQAPNDHDLILLGVAGETSNPAVLTSSDAGEHWAVRDSHIYAARFVTMWSAKDGFRDAPGSFGKLSGNMYTRDSGKTYRDEGVDSTFRHYLDNDTVNANVAWPDSLRACYSLYSSIATDTGALPILVTTDQGKKWSARKISIANLAPPLRLTQVYMRKDLNSIWIKSYSAAATFVYSADFGSSWNACRSYVGRIYSIEPSTDHSLWASAVIDTPLNLNSKHNLLLYSSNNGQTWSEDSLAVHDYSVKNLHFIDSTHGWLLAEKDSGLYVFKYSPPLHVRVANTFRQIERLVAFPNPAHDQIAVPLRSGNVLTGISVSDVLGIELSGLRTTFTSNLVTIDVSSLLSGSYIAKLSFEKRVELFPFLVHK